MRYASLAHPLLYAFIRLLLSFSFSSCFSFLSRFLFFRSSFVYFLLCLVFFLFFVFSSHFSPLIPPLVLLPLSLTYPPSPSPFIFSTSLSSFTPPPLFLPLIHPLKFHSYLPHLPLTSLFLSPIYLLLLLLHKSLDSIRTNY